jgi:hypothetical protein
MSDRRGKVLSFGPFELLIGNMLVANGATKAVAYAIGCFVRFICRPESSV